MNLRNITLSLLCVFVLFSSCKKDDTSDSPTFVEADRTEQQMIDNDSLIGYLETHYYNSATFETSGNYSISDIVITELPKDIDGNYLAMPKPDENTLLIDDVETKTTTYLDVVYEFYILKLNKGGGNAPHFTDNVLVNYSGMLQNDVVFDSTVNAESPFDLLNLVHGWRLVMPEFNTADGFMENGDGTVSYNNYGLGVMFLPSGLAYFASPPIGITSYSNLIFKFELYKTELNDHDEDLVPSYLEDLNANGSVFDDDSDEDNVPNFLDLDDDGDGVLTKYEDLNKDGNLFNDDSDGDGVPNFLDKDSKESNQD